MPLPYQCQNLIQNPRKKSKIHLKTAWKTNISSLPTKKKINDFLSNLFFSLFSEQRAIGKKTKKNEREHVFHFLFPIRYLSNRHSSDDETQLYSLEFLRFQAFQKIYNSSSGIPVLSRNSRNPKINWRENKETNQLEESPRILLNQELCTHIEGIFDTSSPSSLSIAHWDKKWRRQKMKKGKTRELGWKGFLKRRAKIINKLILGWLE